jgi:UrcA family protein
MLKHIIIAAFALAAASAAQAQSNDIPAVKVSVAGIDSQSASGARILLQRIQAAAGQVCGGAPSQVLDRKRIYEPCVQEVTARTVAGMNNPRLAALINGKAEPAAKLASAR